MKWSIIIFCYNEAGNLKNTVTRCHQLVSSISTAFEVLIVNDGSTDHTQQVCNELALIYPEVKIITHSINLGIGPALKTGYHNARFDYVCAIPGDGQFDPVELKGVKPFDVNTFYSFYRQKNDYNLYRKALTFTNKYYNQLLLGISLYDVNWIKVYRKEQLVFTNIQLNSSILESEICAKLIKAGCIPIQLPSVYRARLEGEPKGGSWKTLRAAIVETWPLFRAVRKFKIQIGELNKAVSA